MGGINVKNTIVERVLQIVAPHPCLGCGKVGAVLCQYCKYDISHEPFFGCIVCQAPSLAGICEEHAGPIERVFVVGERQGVLERAVNDFKFHNKRSAAWQLAELLDTRLPYLNENTIITPIPTVRSHSRVRGYDHALLLASLLASRRSVPLVQPLVRATNTTQHTVDKVTRLRQAAEAFGRIVTVDVRGKTVVLVDDVITTGATVMAAAGLLRAAGARVWVVALAYET